MENDVCLLCWGCFVFARMPSKTSCQDSGGLTLHTYSQGHFYYQYNELHLILISLILRSWICIFHNSVESELKNNNNNKSQWLRLKCLEL